MSLSITTVTREAGANCDHVVVTYDHEGTSRQFKTNFRDIDALFADMSPIEQLRMLVMLWAKYRRQNSRTVPGVVIA